MTRPGIAMAPELSAPSDLHLPATFKSAVGFLYYGIVVFVFAITGVAFSQSFEERGMAMLFPFLVTAIFGCGPPVWLLFATDYTVTNTVLLVRCGPFKWRINRQEIRDIRPTRNAVASPALSLNRLEIRYGTHGVVLVSPQDRKGFIEALGFTPPARI